MRGCNLCVSSISVDVAAKFDFMIDGRGRRVVSKAVQRVLAGVEPLLAGGDWAVVLVFMVLLISEVPAHHIFTKAFKRFDGSILHYSFLNFLIFTSRYSPERLTL